MPQWHEHTDQSLIEYAAGHLPFGVPASMEMQRRLMAAVKDLNIESTRHSTTMIRLTRATIVLTVVIGLVGVLQLFATLRPGPGQPIDSTRAVDWQGFVYDDVAAMSGVPIDRNRLASAPRFRSLQECVGWGRKALASPAAGFECSSGCRFDEAIGEVLCADSSRIMR